MRPLAQWSVLRVVLVCVSWVVLCALVPMVWVAIQLRSRWRVYPAPAELVPCRSASIR